MVMDEKDLQDNQTVDSAKEDELKKDTAFSQQDRATGATLQFGTVKITPKYAAQAIRAIKNKVEDTGLAEYTKTRVDQINANYKAVAMNNNVENATHQVNTGETRNASQDWKDDLYEVFQDFGDSLVIKAKKNVLDRHLTRKLEVDQTEDSKAKGAFRSLVKTAAEQEGIQIEEKERYYFKCADAIKQLVVDGVKKAKIREKLEDFHHKGLISGMFMVKKRYARSTTRVLKRFEDADKDKKGQYLALGDYVKDFEREKVFSVDVVDTRKIIHRKDKITWIIEIIDTSFSNLLNATLDMNDEPLKDAPYDYEMLKLAEEDVMKNIPESETDDMKALLAEANAYEFIDVKSLDGDVTVYEGHDIPIVYNTSDLMQRKERSKIKKGSTKSSMTLLSTVACIKSGDRYIPIKVQPSAWEDEYEYCVFAKKNDDVAGMGLPEVLKAMQSGVDTALNQIFDLVDLGIKGITVIDDSKLQNPSALGNLSSGQIIHSQDTGGARIAEIFQQYRPDMGAVGPMGEILDRLSMDLRRTSRKGPTGEKMPANTTATEYAGITQELLKSVNRVGLRLNDLWVKVVTDVYVYTLLHADGNFSMKLDGYKRGTKTNEVDPDDVIIPVNKWVEVKPEDVFVDGISFEIQALENSQKQALARQQAMQFLKLIKESGMDVNPATGQAVVYYDDTETPVVINVFAILDKLAKAMDQDDIWKPLVDHLKSQAPPAGQPPAATGGSPAGQPPSVPPLGDKQNPKTADLLTGAVQT